MRVKLCLYNSARLEQEFCVDDFPLTVGRSREADVCLDDRWASRHHCELVWEDGLVVVRDLNSKHGTLVNQRLIREAALHPGDRLGVGLSSIMVEYQSDRQDSTDTLETAARRHVV